MGTCPSIYKQNSTAINLVGDAAGAAYSGRADFDEIGATGTSFRSQGIYDKPVDDYLKAKRAMYEGKQLDGAMVGTDPTERNYQKPATWRGRADLGCALGEQQAVGAGAAPADCIEFALNGKRVVMSASALAENPHMTLLQYLRTHTSMRGTKMVCEQGGCGACTVTIGRAVAGKVEYHGVNSCLTLLCSLDGAQVTTTEGLGQ